MIQTDSNNLCSNFIHEECSPFLIKLQYHTSVTFILVFCNLVRQVQGILYHRSHQLIDQDAGVESWFMIIIHGSQFPVWPLAKKKILFHYHYCISCFWMPLHEYHKWALDVRLAIMESKDILTNDIWIVRSNCTKCQHNSIEYKWGWLQWQY